MTESADGLQQTIAALDRGMTGKMMLPLARATAMATRRRLFERLHATHGASHAAGMPGAASTIGHGGDRRSRRFRDAAPPTFRHDAAVALGISPFSVDRLLRRFDRIAPVVRQTITERLPHLSGSDLDAIGTLPQADQGWAVMLLYTGFAKTVQEAVKRASEKAKST